MTEYNAKRFRFQMGDGDDDDEWYQIQWNAVAFGIYNILYVMISFSYANFVTRCRQYFMAWQTERQTNQINTNEMKWNDTDCDQTDIDKMLTTTIVRCNIYCTVYSVCYFYFYFFIECWIICVLPVNSYYNRIIHHFASTLYLSI